MWQVRRLAGSQSDRQPLRSRAPLTAIRGSIAGKNSNHLLAPISILFAYCWAINGVLCRVMWLLNRVCFPHWAKCTVWLSSANCCWLTLPHCQYACVCVSMWVCRSAFRHVQVKKATVTMPTHHTVILPVRELKPHSHVCPRTRLNPVLRPPSFPENKHNQSKVILAPANSRCATWNDVIIRNLRGVWLSLSLFDQTYGTFWPTPVGKVIVTPWKWNDVATMN